jgi:hypothetical protein
MSDIVEAVARALCVAEGIDPDKTSIGFGHRIPKGVEYKLWEAQREKAEAAIAAAEVERLRARVEVLERALRRIQATPHPSVAAQCTNCYNHQKTATYALEDAAP